MTMLVLAGSVVIMMTMFDCDVQRASILDENRCTRLAGKVEKEY